MPDTHQKIPRNVLIVAFVALASGFGQDLISPALPAFLTLLGVSAGGIGLIDGLLQGATNVFRFVSGELSDRYRDRKGLIFIGYALSSVARPLLALAGSFGAIASLRLLDGMGTGMKDAPRDALVADSAVKGSEGRAFGFQRFVDTAGSVLGPLVAAGLLLALSASLSTYRLIFWLSAIPGAIALGLILFGVREPARSQRAAPTKGRLPAAFWLFAVAVTLATLTKVNDSLFLVRAAELGVPKAWVPVVFAGFTLIYAVLAYPAGILSDRLGKTQLILAGWLTLAVVQVGFSFDANIWHMLFLFAFYGIFYALTEGTGRALIAELVPAESRGRAYAFYYTLTGVSVIAGGYGLGHVWDVVSPEAAFRVAAVGSLLSCAIFAALIFGRRRRAVTA